MSVHSRSNKNLKALVFEERVACSRRLDNGSQWGASLLVHREQEHPILQIVGQTTAINDFYFRTKFSPASKTNKIVNQRKEILSDIMIF